MVASILKLLGAGLGQIDVGVIDPQGNRNAVPCRVVKVDDDTYRCDYAAQAPGPHKVEVSFAGQKIPKSPFNVNVSKPVLIQKVRAVGRGLQPTGVRVGDVADFKVYTEGAGDGKLEAQVIGPDGKATPVNIKKAADGTTYECDYKPTQEGNHSVVVTFAGQEIFRSPFDVSLESFYLFEFLFVCAFSLLLVLTKNQKSKLMVQV